ncbi:MAG TPA: metallophosphoesterase [Beijerinckiaceae bacterium]|nr:metallophosphoesterase [Beijerinckiaceae bacterium]
MKLVTRRCLMSGAASTALLGGALSAYAFGVEPGLVLDTTTYRLSPPKWPAGLRLKIAVIADLHTCEPYMSAARVRGICEIANAMKPDLTVILGDFNGGHMFVTGPVWPQEWAEALTVLKAPLGVWSILGNHDWWHGPLPNMRGDEGESVRKALRSAGVGLLENTVVRLTQDGRPFWLAGLADQLAYGRRHGQWRGADDLNGTLAQVTDDAPVLLLAHEPLIFPRVPARVALTLCGHTHGGQVNFPIIGSPFARERFGAGLYYGHIVEGGRHMIISGGLGESILPVRFMRPPELVKIIIETA